MSSAGRLAGQVAVVTGGGRGIGRAVVELFAAEGAAVVVWELVPPGQRWWEEWGGAVVMEEVDVADASAVVAAAAGVGARFGGVDVLVNNAGVNLARQPRLEDLGEEELQRVLEINLKGAVRVARALAPLMGGRGGRIVNLSSILATQGFAGHTAYAASKAALEAVTRVWARELGPAGITVNAVAPGYIDTELNAGLPGELRRAVVGRTPLRRLGTPQDVARACLFLASAEAAFITGVCLPVDGGLRL